MDSMVKVKEEVLEYHVSISDPVGRNFRRLPSEILNDIASRVPATSIKHLKRLSKFWYDLLTEFVDLHSTQALQKPPGYLFIPSYKTPRVNPEVFSLALSDVGRSTHTTSKIFEFSTNRKQDLLQGGSNPERRDWIQSSGGLMCVYTRESNHFRIFNPHTNKEVEIPGVPKFKKYHDVKCFFSYSPSTKEYKILKLGFLSHQSNYSTVGAICTLGSDIWTKLHNKVIPTELSHISTFAECQGNLFFWTSHFTLVSFDIVSEKFRDIIPGPPHYLQYYNFNLISIGDTVGYLHDDTLIVLRDKTKGIWTQIDDNISIIPPSLHGTMDVAGVLENNGGMFGFVKDSSKVFNVGIEFNNVTDIIINIKDEGGECEETGWTSVRYVGKHIESLVSPVRIVENGKKLYRKRKWALDRLLKLVDDETKDDLFNGVYQVLNAYEERQFKANKTKSTTVHWEKKSS